MYWWYALSLAGVIRLRALVGDCPDRLNAQCSCSIHENLRRNIEQLWGGVEHAVIPGGKIKSVWISVEEHQDKVTLTIDEQKGIGHAI
jgi:hypothetical protein